MKVIKVLAALALLGLMSGFVMAAALSTEAEVFCDATKAATVSDEMLLQSVRYATEHDLECK